MGNTSEENGGLAKRCARLSLLTFLWGVATGQALSQMQVVPSIMTVAGNGTASFSGDGGQATSATFHTPNRVAVDPLGNIYISDNSNARVRKVNLTTGVITTVAGTGTTGYSGDGGPATSANISPNGVAVDAFGNVYVADDTNYRVRKVTAATGIITTIAGTGTYGYSGDGGQATSAQIGNPAYLAFDSSGNLYVADLTGNRIRKVNTATGVITTVAGNGTGGHTGDGGAATSAEISGPAGLAFDTAGNMYIAEYYNCDVRKVTLATGYISTVAGTAGSCGFSGDGASALSAQIGSTSGIAVDGTNNIYIADASNSRIRMVSASSGYISTFAGNGSTSYTGDGGLPASAGINSAPDVAVDSANNFYIVDRNNVIRRVAANTSFNAPAIGSGGPSHNVLLQTTAAETISSITAQPSAGSHQEFTVGTVTGCTTNGTTSNPSATTCTVPITFNPAYPGLRQVPLIVVTGTGTSRFGLTGYGLGPLATLTPGLISTVAGTGTAGYSGDGAAATSAQMSNPQGAAVDNAGNVYIADYANNVVRKVNASTGVISTVAGNGTAGYSGDGAAATSAKLYSPDGLGIDAAGNIYIADKRNSRIRKVTPANGFITTIAGSGTQGYSGDGGLATSAALNAPAGTINFDSLGNFYFSDGGNCTVRKVNTTTGIITTLAGNGTCAYAGDGGAATSAELYGPSMSNLDANGNYFIGEYSDGRVRKVTFNSGLISTVAGNGTSGYSGDGGAATSAELKQVVNVAQDTAGNLYVADAGNNRIRFINTGTGIISTIAGTGAGAYNGDGGAATSAALYAPNSIVLDSAGNLVIDDASNNVIRKVNVSQSALVFPTSTAVGTLDSSDGAKAATLNNIGNGSLTISTPSSGTNPSIGAYFSFDSSSTCSELSTVSAAVTLASGSACTIALDFTPGAVGVVNSSAILTDTSLNVAGSTQTISLSGTGVAVATTTVVSSSANPSTYSGSVTLTATVAPVSGSNVPAGTVQFTIDGTAAGGALTLNGSGAATYTTATLTGGNHNVSAAFTPGSASFSASTSSTFTQTVNKATPSLSWYTPSPITYGTALSATQLDCTSGGLPGTFVYSPAAGTVLAAGNYQLLSATFTPTDTTDYNVTPGYALINVNQATKTINFPQPSTPVSVNGTATLAATASGGDPITYTVTSGTAALSGSTITYTNAGSVTIQANSAASTNYSAASPVSQTVVVNAALSAYVAPATLVGSTSPTQTATVNISAAGTLNSISVVTQGAAGLDFSYVSGGTCATGTAYTAGQACTVQYTFSPKYPGQRLGAVLLYTSSPALMGTSYLSGSGTGPLGLFTTPVATTLSSSVTSGRGISLDGSGNLYVTGPTSSAVYKITAGGTLSTITSAISNPSGSAVDGAGNLFVGNSSSGVITEIPAGTSTLTTIATISGGVDNGLVADASGNLYVASATSHNIYQVAAGTYNVTQILTGGQAVSGGTLGRCIGLTIDSSNNLYLADYTNNRIYKVTNGTWAVTTLVNNDGNLSGPQGIAIDPAGDLYVSNSNGTIIRYSAGSYTAKVFSTSTYKGLGSIAMDASGSIYTSLDSTTSVYKFSRVATPTLSFSATFAGAVSADQLEGFENDGNASLTFSSLTGTNASFYAPDTTCTTSSALAAGSTCNLGVAFAPATAGTPVTGAANVVDNTLNAGGTLQQVPVSGTATSDSTSTSVASSSNPSSYSGSVTFTATVSNTSGVAQTPAGTVQFSVDGSNVGSAVALSGGTATYTTLTLTHGTHSIVAVFTAGSTTFASSTSSVLTQTVNRTTPTVSWTAPSAITYGTPLSATQLNATSGGIAGTFVYTPASGTILSAGTAQTLSAAFTPSDTNDYNNASGSTTITVLQATGTISLATSATPSTYGTAITLTATAPVPGTGLVTFKDSGTPIGTGTLSGGTATLTISSLAAGTHTLTASWPGDTNYTAATSTSILQTVNRAAANIVFTSTLNPSRYGDLVSLQITVSGTVSTPTGAISLKDGGTTLASLPLTAGTASYSISTLAAASHSLLVTYGGDSNFY